MDLNNVGINLGFYTDGGLSDPVCNEKGNLLSIPEGDFYKIRNILANKNVAVDNERQAFLIYVRKNRDNIHFQFYCNNQKSRIRWDYQYLLVSLKSDGNMNSVVCDIILDYVKLIRGDFVDKRTEFLKACKNKLNKPQHFIDSSADSYVLNSKCYFKSNLKIDDDGFASFVNGLISTKSDAGAWIFLNDYFNQNLAIAVQNAFKTNLLDIDDALHHNNLQRPIALSNKSESNKNNLSQYDWSGPEIPKATPGQLRNPSEGVSDFDKKSISEQLKVIDGHILGLRNQVSEIKTQVTKKRDEIKSIKKGVDSTHAEKSYNMMPVDNNLFEFSRKLDPFLSDIENLSRESKDILQCLRRFKEVEESSSTNKNYILVWLMILVVVVFSGFLFYKNNSLEEMNAFLTNKIVGLEKQLPTPNAKSVAEEKSPASDSTKSSEANKAGSTAPTPQDSGGTTSPVVLKHDFLIINKDVLTKQIDENKSAQIDHSKIQVCDKGKSPTSLDNKGAMVYAGGIMVIGEYGPHLKKQVEMLIELKKQKKDFEIYLIGNATPPSNDAKNYQAGCNRAETANDSVKNHNLILGTASDSILSSIKIKDTNKGNSVSLFLVKKP